MAFNLDKENKFIDDIKKEITEENYDRLMSEIYKRIKMASLKESDFDNLLIDKIINIEDKFRHEIGSNIIDVKVPFVTKNSLTKMIKESQDGGLTYNLIRRNMSVISKDEEFIKYIVQNVREKILSDNYLMSDNIDLGCIDFINCCYSAAEYTSYLCDKHNVKNKKIKIYPGFGEYGELNSDLMMQHHATFLSVGGEYYLVDVTYSQFFKKGKNSLDRLGVYGFSGSYVGSYMLIDEERLNIAIKLIKDGYVKLDKNVLKKYMDGFALSFRNGLFYENNSISSYTTSYTDDDYLKFLYTDDNQINLEGKENLGRQLKLLKNPSLDFRSFVK